MHSSKPKLTGLGFWVFFKCTLKPKLTGFGVLVFFYTGQPRNEVLREHFSSLGIAMITLTQFITMDSISAVYFPLIKLQPVVFLYFAILILIVSISVPC